jgi:6-phosphogluconate dehydrogenase
MAGFGIYGLGRMGQAIARRLLRQGHEVHVYNRSPDPIALLAKEGAQSAASLADLVGQLEAPRCIWLMLPAGEATDQAILAWPTC